LSQICTEIERPYFKSCICDIDFAGEVFDYLVAHGRMKEKEARAKFRQVCNGIPNLRGKQFFTHTSGKF
jgi:hypothetical protein